MFTLVQDIRYALRQLRHAPAFTITAVLTLALGIGANTAVFTMVQQVLMNALPVGNPGGLYRVGDKYNCCVEGDLQKDWSMFSYGISAGTRRRSAMSCPSFMSSSREV